MIRGGGRRFRVVASLAAAAIVAALLPTAMLAAAPASAEPREPFASYQYGTAGCIEVGVRPERGQNPPMRVPTDYDRTVAYPTAAEDRAGWETMQGTNSCRYNFYDAEIPKPAPKPLPTPLTSGYCVEWAAGQRSNTGYDPERWDGTIENQGLVLRVLTDNWPAQPMPAVPSTNPTTINALRSGAVAMAVHWFTDGIVMPAVYQTPGMYEAVADVVNRAIAAGALPDPSNPGAFPDDPTPAIDGPPGAVPGDLTGPWTIGANATGDVTVTLADADGFLDAGGTQPFTSGSTLPPGGQLWLRTTGGDPAIDAIGPVVSVIGTVMAGDPAFNVQRMMLAEAATMVGKATREIRTIRPSSLPSIESQVAVATVEQGGRALDFVDVTGLGLGEDATLTMTLYGPVEAVDGSCDVDWTTAPALEALPPTTGGNNRYEFLTEPLTELACYSFGAVLTRLNGLPITVLPGEPTETLLVEAAPTPPIFTVTSQVSAAVLAPGDPVSDVVTITGVPDGETLAVTPTVLGPVAADPATGCADVDWLAADLPVAATLPEVAVGNGTHTFGPVTLTAPGCYTWTATATHQLLTGGAEPVTHGAGVTTEAFQIVDPVQPTPEPTPTPGTSAGGTPPATLPATGTDTAGWLWQALLMVGAGTSFMLVSRRRREAPKHYEPETR